VRIMRLAITREDEGAREVPVAINVIGSDEKVASSEEMLRLKNRVGTDPQVSGAMNVATADWPGCRKRSNLWTSLEVFPPCENRGLMRKRRGPHCMISSCFDLIGSG